MSQNESISSYTPKASKTIQFGTSEYFFDDQCHRICLKSILFGFGMVLNLLCCFNMKQKIEQNETFHLHGNLKGYSSHFIFILFLMNTILNLMILSVGKAHGTIELTGPTTVYCSDGSRVKFNESGQRLTFLSRIHDSRFRFKVDLSEISEELEEKCPHGWIKRNLKFQPEIVEDSLRKKSEISREEEIEAEELAKEELIKRKNEGAEDRDNKKEIVTKKGDEEQAEDLNKSTSTKSDPDHKSEKTFDPEKEEMSVSEYLRFNEIRRLKEKARKAEKRSQDEQEEYEEYDEQDNYEDEKSEFDEDDQRALSCSGEYDNDDKRTRTCVEWSAEQAVKAFSNKKQCQKRVTKPLLMCIFWQEQGRKADFYKHNPCVNNGCGLSQFTTAGIDTVKRAVRNHNLGREYNYFWDLVGRTDSKSNVSRLTRRSALDRDTAVVLSATHLCAQSIHSPYYSQRQLAKEYNVGNGKISRARSRSGDNYGNNVSQCIKQGKWKANPKDRQSRSQILAEARKYRRKNNGTLSTPRVEEVNYDLEEDVSAVEGAI